MTWWKSISDLVLIRDIDVNSKLLEQYSVPFKDYAYSYWIKVE